MQTIGKLLGVVLLVGLSLQMFGGNYGESYDNFKKNSMNLSEEDMHMLHDAFHINLHFTEEQANDLISQIKGKVTSAQTQSTQIGTLITSTQSLIQFVKETKDAITNPSNYLKNSISKIFGRNLVDIGTNAQQVISNLESKVAEAKANQGTIDKSLDSATRFLQSLELVKNLFSENSSIWSKLKSFFGFSAAHLEKLAAQPENFRGKRRLSLYQQQARSERLFSTADKIKRALHYLNTTPENKLNVHDLEKHLYDLIEEEGTFGRVYLRYVETLRCILLKECEISATTTTTTVITDQGVEGENPTLGQIIATQEEGAEPIENVTEETSASEGETTSEGQAVVVNAETPEEVTQAEPEPEESVAVTALEEAAAEESEGGEEAKPSEEVVVVSTPEETITEVEAAEEAPVSENEPAIVEAKAQEQAEAEAGTEPSKAEEEQQLDQAAQEESEITEQEDQQQTQAVVTESTPAEEEVTPAEEENVPAQTTETSEETTEETITNEEVAAPAEEKQSTESIDKQIEEAVKEEEEAAQAIAQEPTKEETSVQEEPAKEEVSAEIPAQQEPAKQEETVVQNQSGVYEPVKNEQGEQQIPQEEEPTDQNPVVYLGEQQVINVNSGEITNIQQPPSTGNESIYVQNESKDVTYPALSNIIAVPAIAENQDETTASGL